MSKILLNGFRTDPNHTDLEAILLSRLFWYDKINNKIKVGNKVLNYYIENEEKYLTTLTQAELPGKNILALEFSVLSSI
jgi:hypothetical protein